MTHDIHAEMAIADLDAEFGPEPPLWSVCLKTALAVAVTVGGSALAAALFTAWC